GLATFFTDVATGAEDAGDALVNMATNFAKSIINALAQMAAQWLVYQAVQMLVGKTTQAGAAATISANAQAMSLQAGLAAYASTAAIPIIGPAAAPAAMATALTITGPLASAVGMTAMAGAMGGFQEGGYTGNIGVTQVAGVVHGKEYVFDAEATARIGVGTLEAMSNGRPAFVNQSSGAEMAPSSAPLAPIINLIEDSSRAGQSQSRQVDGRWVIDQVVANIRDNGKGAKAIQEMLGMGRAAR
ncbi:tail tape measure protein, partial [Pseudomonas lactis]